MVLHVGRDRAGRRRLREIAVLAQTGAGRVRAHTVWHADRGAVDQAGALRELLGSRRRA